MTHTEGRAALPIPDFGDWKAMSSWLATSRVSLRDLQPTDELVASVTSVAHEPGAALGPVGRYGDACWRSFVAATFLADLACYPEPADQVGFERLLYVMHVFPRGFRLWGVDLRAGVPGAGWLPVGYTGWYPIARTSFELLEGQAASLRDRMVVPLPAVEPEGSFLYLFNFSILPQLRGTSAAKRLVRTLAEDVNAQRHRGLAAITVSADGARIAERFGMAKTGSLLVEGAEESVYTSRTGG